MNGDVEVWATVRSGPFDQGAAMDLGIVTDVGGTGALDGYVLRAFNTSGGAGWGIRKLTNWAATDLIEAPFGPSGAPTAGHIILFRRSGSSLQGWRSVDGGVNWTLEISTTDSQYTSNFRVGLGHSVALASSPSWDAFGGGATSAGTDQTTGTCGAGVHANTAATCQDDPVHSLTGAFTTGVTDLRLPGIGVPFSWKRSYTSSDATTARLGPGWTDSYGTSLSVQGNGDVILRGDEGQRVYYTKQGSTFVGAPGALSTLSSITGGYELMRRDQVAYRFDTQGRLTSMKDRNAQGLTFAYNGSGQLQTITDSVNRQIALTHTGGLLTRVTLPDARYVEYGYTAGRLASVRDARGETTLYTYDAGGRLESIVDQNLHTVVDNTYGTDGRVIQQVNARGKTGTFSWNPTTQTQTYTDARLHQWKDVYANSRLVERIDPLGNSIKFEYDSALNVTKVTDARLNATTMTYDGRANMLTRIAPAPLSYAETWTYTVRNDPLTYQDGRGGVTDFGYDAPGNLTSITGPDPDGGGPATRPLTQLGRDPAGTGLLSSLTDPRGKQTTFGYTAGNLTEIRTPLQRKTTMGYDGSGRLTSLVDPRGYASGANPADFTWEYGYNAADQITSQEDPLGNLTSLLYDPAGNLEERANANGRTTEYGYDAANNLTAVTAPDPDGVGPLLAPVTQYAYDDVDNVASRRDANLRDTLYAYDNANRLTTLTAPLNRVWTYGYDAAGNVTQVVDANGNATGTPGDGQTTYGYDVLNRLSSINYSDTTADVTFAYDANDNRTQMIDGSGTQTRVYDALDRLSSVTRAGSSFSYGYDANGNITKRTYPDATIVDSTFDDDSRLATVVGGGRTVSYGYDLASNLLTRTFPSQNGHVETRTYDRAGRLLSTRHAKGANTLLQVVYTRDPVGNPLTEVTTGATPGTKTFSYDSMDRMTGVCFQAGTCPGGSDPFIRWSYDGVSNRLSETRPTGATAYTYNAADELTQRGATSYAYDNNGNVLSTGTRTFAWDLANRVKSTTLSPTTTTYSYDGDGTRLQASTGSSNSLKTNFVWDVNRALPQLVRESSGADALRRRYFNGLEAEWASAMADNSNPRYLHRDLLGSVRAMTGQNGGTTRTYDYEPFGATRAETGTSPENFVKFAGEYEDPTGLYHLRARQYEPQSGRFLSRDPVAAPLSDPHGSAYGYVAARPTVWTDPSGLRWCDPLCDVPNVAGGVVEVGVAKVGQVIEDHNVDVALTVTAVTCFIVVPEAAPACALIGAGAFAASSLRSAVESGVVGDRPTNYCRFGLSVGSSTLVFGAGTAISRLWSERYVVSATDRRVLRAATEFIGGDIEYLSGAGAAAACESDHRGSTK